MAQGGTMTEEPLLGLLAMAIKDAETSQERADAMHRQADEATAARARAEADLAAERATSQGLREQLAAERQAHAQTRGHLGQAIAAKAPGEQPVYEMFAGERDGNGRWQKITLRPVKKA